MGLDTIIKNNPDWDNNVNSIYINNNICKSIKEINRRLKEDFENGDKNNKYLKEHLQKSNKNFKKLTEEEEKKKMRKQQEENKSKKKFNNSNYFD
jgi:hypothetical protein